MEHILQLRGIFLIHDHQLVIQHALNAVERAVDLGDVRILQTGLDHAVGRAVDNRGRTAGLTDDQGAFKDFFRHLYNLQNIYGFLFIGILTAICSPIPRHLRV